MIVTRVLMVVPPIACYSPSDRVHSLGTISFSTPSRAPDDASSSVPVLQTMLSSPPVLHTMLSSPAVLHTMLSSAAGAPDDVLVVRASRCSTRCCRRRRCSRRCCPRRRRAHDRAVAVRAPDDLLTVPPAAVVAPDHVLSVPVLQTMLSSPAVLHTMLSSPPVLQTMLSVVAGAPDDVVVGRRCSRRCCRRRPCSRRCCRRRRCSRRCCRRWRCSRRCCRRRRCSRRCCRRRRCSTRCCRRWRCSTRCCRRTGAPHTTRPPTGVSSAPHRTLVLHALLPGSDDAAREAIVAPDDVTRPRHPFALDDVTHVADAVGR